MNPDQWTEVRRIAAAARQHESRERDAFIRKAAGGDAELEAEVWSELREAETLVSDGPAESPDISDEDRIGELVGRYRVLSLIGEGGMGAVYLAEDTDLNRKVALKLIKSGFKTKEFLRRFGHERQILAQLNHDNIARLLDVGTTSDGIPFLVMEYVEGRPLDEYANSHALSIADRLALFRTVCAAVQHAHQSLIIHRDLKPTNILVSESGQPKLLDFGIAKLIDPDDAGSIEATVVQALTPAYASPEQILGEPTGTATDIYSLGVVLYELLTGSRPYKLKRRTVDEITRAICEIEPERPSTVIGRTADAGRGAGPKTTVAAPSAAAQTAITGEDGPAFQIEGSADKLRRRLRGDLDNILLMALRKDPRRRYSSVEQFSDDIRRHLEGRPVLARGDAFSYVAAKFMRRNKIALSAAALVFIALAAGGIATYRAEMKAERRFEEVRKLAHSVLFNYNDAIAALPGSTPVRQMLVKDGLQYLDTLSREADDVSLRRELVEAYVRVSQIQGNTYYANLGDMSGASASAKKAVALGQQLVRRDSDPRSLRALASAYAAEAELLHDSNHLQAANDDYRTSISLRDTVIKQTPNDYETQLEQAVVMRHLGDLLGAEGGANLGKPVEGQAFYARALDVSEALLKRFPQSIEARREVYNGYLDRAVRERTLGHHQAAEDWFRKVLAMIQAISAADPRNTGDRSELSNSLLMLGSQLADNGKPREALPYLEKSVAIEQGLAAEDPANVNYGRNVSVIETYFVNVLRQAGEPKAALPHAEKALAIAEQLSAADPGSAEILSDVALSHRKVGQVLMDLHRYPDAMSRLTKALGILRAMSAKSSDANLQGAIARCALDAGDTDMALNQPAAAIDYYRESERIGSALAKNDPGQMFIRVDLARSQGQLGAAYMRVAKWQDARAAYQRAFENWSAVRSAGALKAEDTNKLADTTAAIARCDAALHATGGSR